MLTASTTKGTSMNADLDLLLIAVYVTADDLLPERSTSQRVSSATALARPTTFGQTSAT